MKFAILFAIVVAVCQTGASPTNPAADDEWVLIGKKVPDWGYSGKVLTPAHWGEKYPTCKEGKKQTPVPISSTASEYKKYDPLEFLRYYVPLDMNIRNEWRMILATLQCDDDPKTAADCKRPGLRGGPIPKGTEYLYTESRFIIGSDSTHGSENAIDGKTYPFEMVRVYYNNAFSSYLEASSKPNGLLYQHFLFHLDNSFETGTKTIKKMMESIQQPNASYAFRLENLGKSIWGFDNYLTKWDNRFYVIEASKTTPPCTENVIHIVFADSAPMPEAQLEAIRSVMDESGQKIVNNLREMQTGSTAKVYRSFENPAEQKKEEPTVNAEDPAKKKTVETGPV